MKLFRFLQRKANPVIKSQPYYWAYSNASWTTANYDSYATNFYAKNAIASRCLNTIASTASAVTIYLKDKRKNKFVDAHPILELLTHPNPLDTWQSLLTRIILDYYLDGNAFVVKNADNDAREPLELWPINPSTVKVIPASDGTIREYEVVNETGTIVLKTNAAGGFSPVMHVKAPNPIDPYRGVAQMQAAGASIDIHNEINRYSKATMQNDARPSGILRNNSADGMPLTDEQIAALKTQIDETMSGSRNARRPLLLDGNLEWQQIAMTPAQLDYIENKADVAREICIALGYPPLLLGLKGDNTYANYQEARIALYEETILPMLDKILAEFNRWIFNFYKEDSLQLCYDPDSISALRPRRLQVLKDLEPISYLTDNEKRELAGFDSIDGGDVYYKPANMLPAGFMLDAQEQEERAQWIASLEAKGYTKEQAEKLAKLVYDRT